MPIYFRTSNFINTAGHSVYPHLHWPFVERYEWLRYPWTAHDSFVREAGQRLSAGERAELQTVVRANLRQGTGPAPIERQLVKTIRDAALRLEQSGNAVVGSSIVSSCLPRAAFESLDPTLRGAEPDLVSASFRYYPEDADNPVQHVPNLVVPQLKLVISGIGLDFSALGGSGEVLGRAPDVE